MEQAQLNWIANFIWGIADDVKPLRTLEEIRADILALERETEGLLDAILGKSGQEVTT